MLSPLATEICAGLGVAGAAGLTAGGFAYASLWPRRFFHKSFHIGGDEDDIGATALGQLLELCRDIRSPGIYGKGRAAELRELKAAGDGVGGEDRAAAQFQKHGEEQADRALALDEHDIVRLRIALLHGFQTSVERLDEGGDFEGHAIGNFLDAALDDPIHDADVLGESAAGGLEAGSDAYLLIDGTLRVEFAVAVEAFAAGNVVEDDDAVAGLELGDAGTR